ncbi:hypothetical protein HDV01_005860 [Terramyces sp. JEL0728]|nr:hypothetical protein HDV01_005860 [Terramyces sp. JEL0728]
MSWKRKEIPDHNFDYIDVDDFIDNAFGRKLSYVTVFFGTLKDFMVYGFEFVSIMLLFSINSSAIKAFFQGQKQDFVVTNFGGSNSTLNESSTNPVISTLGTAPTFFIILLSFLVSFVLVALEWNKSWKVIKSRDISYAFTSTIAYRYYCIRSYPHYCFFNQIQNSRKTVDIMAFWVFFKLRGWMRLLFAEFPRQFLSAGILYSVWLFHFHNQKGNFVNAIQEMFNPYGTGQTVSLVFYVSLQLTTVIIWSISFITLVMAGCIIGEILKKKSKRRLQDIRRQERERIQNGSEYSSENQPTLPAIDFEDEHYAPSVHSEAYSASRYGPPSQYGQSQYGYANPQYPPPADQYSVPGSQYGYSQHDQQYQYANQRGPQAGYSEPRRAYADDDASSYQSSQDSKRYNQRSRYDNGSEHGKSQYSGSPKTPISGKTNPNINYANPNQKDKYSRENSDPYSPSAPPKSDLARNAARRPSEPYDSNRNDQARNNSRPPVDRDGNRSVASRQKPDEKSKRPPAGRQPSDPYDRPRPPQTRQISESFDGPRSGRHVTPKPSTDSYFSDNTSIPDANDSNWRR